MNNNNDLSRHSSATAGDLPFRSFERDVLPVAGDLYRRALAYTKNDAHADDLVQETLLKAYKAFDKLRLETHLRAWLLCIMRNTWINNYRADLRRPVETLVGDIADGQGSTPWCRTARDTCSPPNIKPFATCWIPSWPRHSPCRRTCAKPSTTWPFSA